MNGKIRKTLLMLAAAGPLVIFAPGQARADYGRGHTNVIVESRDDCPSGYRWAQVLVSPGYYRSEEIPAQYGVRYDIHGRPFTVLIKPASCGQVWVDATYQRQLVRVDEGRARAGMALPVPVPAPLPFPIPVPGFVKAHLPIPFPFDLRFGGRR